MKKLTLLLSLLVLAGCVQVGALIDRKTHGENPYKKAPFYARYLNPANQLDAQIQTRIDGLRQDPDSAVLHNELGSLLVQKGFPKDAEREFFRAVASDRRFYPAWYNLGLMREALGDPGGAARAFRETIDIKPGHAAAHFQLGLMAEKRGSVSTALAHYVKAYSINHALLNVRVNPRILDSKLVDRALIEMYPDEHVRQSLQFQQAPPSYTGQRTSESPSPEAEAADIVTPTAPVTDSGVQTAPPAPQQTPQAVPQVSPPPPPPPQPPSQPRPY